MPKANAPQTIRVFHAWQSDISKSTNRYLIRDSLEKAIEKLNASGEHSARIAMDEATRDEPGSPNIATTIESKIDLCDVFVGDVSIINQDTRQPRPVPNPNVVYETGWAAARIGWGRVILLHNLATGPLEDLPFDIRGRRVSSYRADETTSIPAVRNHLSKLLGVAIGGSIASAPPIRVKTTSKPIGTLSPEQRRSRDARTVLEFLSVLDSEWIDSYLRHLREEQILEDADVRYIMFMSVTSAARFHLFDENTAKKVQAFVAAWYEVMAVTRYGDNLDGRYYARFRPEVYATPMSAERLHEKLQEVTEHLNKSFRALLARVKRSYSEFDLTETDHKARAAYENL